MRKIEKTYTGHIQKINWDDEDDYLAVKPMQIQVYEQDGWKNKEKVKVTIIIEEIDEASK